MSATRLWTFQRLSVGEHLGRQEHYLASWDWTPCNWRRAYHWMAKCLEQRIGAKLNGAPIWCWHSCNGKLAAPPTAWTARALLSDYDFEQGIEMLTLRVPDELLLPSSYWAWNEFLDFVIVNRALPRSRRWRRSMFRSPLIKHGTDDIQAVIPFIRAEWVEAVQRIVVHERNWDEPL